LASCKAFGWDTIILSVSGISTCFCFCLQHADFLWWQSINNQTSLAQKINVVPILLFVHYCASFYETKLLINWPF
jgi:hypothetical protein